MEDYKPIDNKRIEDILFSLDKNPEEGHKKIDRLVIDELTPGKKQEQTDKLTDEQKMIWMALFFCLNEYGDKTRDIGNNLASKHPIDTARILVKYDSGNNIDYLTVCEALLHDSKEDMNFSLEFIENNLREYLHDSDIEEKGKYSQGVNKIMKLVLNVTKQEVDYNEFLERVFKNKRAAKIKLADRISQSFEMDEKQYFSTKDKFLDDFKHNLETILGKKRIGILKEKGAKASELDLKQRLLHPKDLMSGILYTIYQNLEHLKFTGDRILNAIYKDFRHIDNACKYINNNEYDPTMIALKDMLIFSSMIRIIYPRMEHLTDGKSHHVSQEEARYAEHTVHELRELGELYRLTGFEGPLKETDIILPFYNPAMKGQKEMLIKLNDFKDKQYLHLAIWRDLFKRYYDDVLNQKQSDLFTFDWNVKGSLG